ncbi:unnamed protein product [Symbiodinium natans]|uniref:Amine oxidase domain-containing protein n=1 Tax=Symbiodinium natans TaxID=878477 RepID=A0A812RD39_9DINO|nr:unnamed protein product [Symbiodinium natans]
MASRMKQLGYTNIRVLERTDRVGGKSLTLYRNYTGECIQQKDHMGKVDTSSCVAHEMGTCFLHNGYHTIRDLVDEYNLSWVVAPEGRAMFSHYAKDQWHSQSMHDFVSASIMDGIKQKKISVPFWALTEELKVSVALVEAVAKYNALHKEIVGEVEFSMPSRLPQESLERINMTFLEFLEGNDLHALSGFLMFAHAAQGYGYVTTIPAFYGLWWISPELLNGYVQMSFRQQLESLYDPHSTFLQSIRGRWVHDLTWLMVGGTADVVKRTTTMLPEGYQKIWTTMAESDALDVRYGVEILEIDRQLHDPTAPVRIKYTQSSNPTEVIEEEYKFLIYSGPHAHAHKYVKDLATEEETIFSQLKSFVLATTIYKSDQVFDYTDQLDAPIMYSADKMSGPHQDGTWYADRYDAAIFSDELAFRNQTRVGYQFYENFCEVDSLLCDSDRTPNQNFHMEVSQKLLDKFRAELAEQRVKNVRVLGQYPWPYFHHFPNSAVMEGLPWDLFEMQGSRKTWWIGASACFESVHDVTNYNLQLLQSYLGATVSKGRVSFE